MVATSDTYLRNAIEEYKTLRDESKQASINMYSALQWGSAIVGVLFSAGFTQWKTHDAVVLAVFCIIVPTACAMSMFLWLGEAMRFKRVGDYICLIEAKVSQLCRYPDPDDWVRSQRVLEGRLGLPESALDLAQPLVWERWLRDTRGRGGTAGHLELVYIIRLGLFPALAGLALAIGTLYSLVRWTELIVEAEGVLRLCPGRWMLDPRWGLVLFLVLAWAWFTGLVAFAAFHARAIRAPVTGLLQYRELKTEDKAAL